MRKILIYSPGALQFYGHSHDYVAGLLDGYKSKNCECTVIAYDGDYSLDLPTSNVIQVIRSKNKLGKGTGFVSHIKWGISRIFYEKKLVSALLKEVQADSYDYVLFETFEYLMLGSHIKKIVAKTAVKVIFHSCDFSAKKENTIIQIYKKLCSNFARKIASKADASYFHGESMRETFKLTTQGSDSSDRYHIIPYGARIFDESKIINKKDALAHLGLDSQFKYALIFGTLRNDKDYEMIFKAIQISKNWRVIIAGPNGDLSLERLKNIVSQYISKDRAIYINRFIPENEQPLIFAASDLLINIYVSGIAHESGTAKTARSYLKPVILGKTADMKSYIKNTSAGWYADKLEDLVNILDSEYDAIDKETLIQFIKEAGKQNSWEAVVAKIDR